MCCLNILLQPKCQLAGELTLLNCREMMTMQEEDGMNKAGSSGQRRGVVMLSALALAVAIMPALADANGFSWPVNCTPGVNCDGRNTRIGFPDISGNGLSYSCGSPGYTGHLGTDILISSVDQQVEVLAAADGVVRWLHDGSFDHCPDSSRWECDEQNKSELAIDATRKASLGFNAGNYIVLEHVLKNTRYLTLYAHLKSGSLLVSNGQRIRRGDRLAQVGSSGNTLTPHLHFGVLRQDGAVYRPVDPWPGACNSTSSGLWNNNPPYTAQTATTMPPPGLQFRSITITKAQQTGSSANQCIPK